MPILMAVRSGRELFSASHRWYMLRSQMHVTQTQKTKCRCSLSGAAFTAN